MKNLILKNGSLVKGLHTTENITKGQIYEVFETGLGLCVKVTDGPLKDLPLVLVDSLGSLTENADSFRLHTCPILTLPVGLNKGQTHETA